MTDWDEIKRLAADFQRTQTSDTLQRISERNCIDIVKKLTELNLIELYYTCDGREFVTPDHLVKEIEDEVYVNGGRMHLHDLAANLNIDYSHIDNMAKELTKTKPDEYNLVLGQIVHSTYKDALGKQINDWLLINGQLSVAEFAKSLDLPSEFLLKIVDELLPRISDELVPSQDGRTFYTTELMGRYKAMIAGALTAISKPATIASLTKRLNIPERIFLPITEGLVKDGRLDAAIENRQFIPSIYAREQNEYIDKFYASNSYITYDVLLRMDIKQPKTFLKKRFPTGIQLQTCYISQLLLTQVELTIEETIATNSWIDIYTVLPSAIEPEDIEELIAIIFKRSKHLSNSCQIFDKTYICSSGYISVCKDIFNNLMPSRAQEDLKKGHLVEYFMVRKTKDAVPEVAKPEDSTGTKQSEAESSDDDGLKNRKSKSRKSMGGGAGGSQGREFKQKNVKKKYFVSSRASQKQAQQTSLQASHQPEPLILMNGQDMVEMIRKDCHDECSDEFLESILHQIELDVNKRYQQIARQVLDEYLKAQEEEKDSAGEQEDKNCDGKDGNDIDKENQAQDNDDTELVE